MIKQLGLIALSTIALASCTSVGQVGAMTRPSADPGAVIREAHPYHEIGPAKGTACRYFLLALVPWGDPTASQALEEALAVSGGDALLNVTVHSSLYTFIPYLNIFTYTCTSVEGTAISYLPPPTPLPPSAPTAMSYEPASTQQRLGRAVIYRSAAEIADAEGITRRFVNRLLRMTLLASHIQRAILDDRPARSVVWIRGGRKVVTARDGSDAWTPAKPRHDETLIGALVRAHRWNRMLEEGRYRSAAEIAEAEVVTRSFFNRLLRLTLLSPD